MSFNVGIKSHIVLYKIGQQRGQSHVTEVLNCKYVTAESMSFNYETPSKSYSNQCKKFLSSYHHHFDIRH